MKTVAALYVDVARGPYASMPGVEAWGVERDATKYDGPHPVVAHPPCGHWGNMAHWCETPIAERELAIVAVTQVRRFGGVLEHPATGKLWREVGLPLPGELPDAWGGFSIAVRQRWWGHDAAKPTLLYVCGCKVAELPPMPEAIPDPPLMKRRNGKRKTACENMARTRRHLTPPAFAEWLVEVARRCGRVVNWNEIGGL